MLLSCAVLVDSAAAQRVGRGSSGPGGRGGGEMRSGGGGRGSANRGPSAGGENRSRGNPGRSSSNRGDYNRGNSFNRGNSGNSGRPGGDRGPGSSWQGNRDRDYGGSYRRDGNYSRYGNSYPGGRYPSYGSRYGYGSGSRYGYGTGSRYGYGTGPRYGYGYGRGGAYNTIPWYLFGGYGRGLAGGYGYGLGNYSYYQGGSYPYYSYYGNNTPLRVYTGRIDPDSADTVAPPANAGEFEEEAILAFRAGDYREAARLANHALVESPDDGRLYLFAAQVMFAVGDYEGSAALVHQAATMVAPSELGTVVENYRQYYRGRDYIDQMDQLIAFLEQDPNSSAALFVRGFQYGFLGHRDAAVKDLTKAYELESRDQLAAELIEQFGGTAPEAAERDSAPLPLPTLPEGDVSPTTPTDAVDPVISP